MFHLDGNINEWNTRPEQFWLQPDQILGSQIWHQAGHVFHPQFEIHDLDPVRARVKFLNGCSIYTMKEVWWIVVIIVV